MRAFRHRQDRRPGSVVVMVAIALVMIVGFAALVIDGGMLFDSSQQVQKSADAAALAAATDLFTNYYKYSGVDTNGTAKQSALTTTSALGFSDGGNSTVTVNIPPLSGAFVGKTGYAEVIITYQQPRYFSKIWSSGTVPVYARAVARGTYLPGSYGILILDPKISDSLEIDGNLNILNGGQIWVNSTASDATQVANTAALTCGGLNLVGNLKNAGSITYTFGGDVKTGVAPVADPLASIPEPTPSTTVYKKMTVTGTATLSPGTYDGLTIDKGAVVTLLPGIYTLQGNGITVGAGATVTGTGVMFYNQSGDNIDFKQSGVINITPPTSGIYAGISVFQPRDDTQEVHIESISNVTMPGTWYAQTGEFDFRPDGANTVYNMGNYICDQMEAGQGYSSNGKSNGQINLNPNTAAPTQRSVQLVE